MKIKIVQVFHKYVEVEINEGNTASACAKAIRKAIRKNASIEGPKVFVSTIVVDEEGDEIYEVEE